MRMRKWFSTIITSEIFLTFMNGFDVYSQVMRMRKWFSTRVTFGIFLIFMNGFHMDSQITSLSIWFSTIFTCEIFVIFLNCFDMNPKRRSPVNDFSQIFVTFMNGFDMTSQVWQKSKWFSTIVTFEFFVAFTKGFGKSHIWKLFLIFVNGFYMSSHCICYKLSEWFWCVFLRLLADDVNVNICDLWEYYYVSS